MKPRVALALLLAATGGSIWWANRSTTSTADQHDQEQDDDTAAGGAMRDVALIVIHHTAASESAWGWEDIRSDHISKGWSDIGYHYGIGADGTTYTGRDEDDVGAHAYGNNADSIGVVLLGDFHDTGTLPTSAQLDSTAELLSELLRTYGLSTDDLQPHSALGSASGHTDCPGFDWDWFMGEMGARLDAGVFA